MKTIKTIRAIPFVLLCFCALSISCYDDDILASKPGEPIDGVSNLSHTVNGNEVVLTWDLPTSFPEGINSPVGVQIVVSKDGQRQGGTIYLPDNPVSYTYGSYDSASQYRFTVKVIASMEVPQETPYISDLWISEGTTLSI